jgi:hypothetical protein
MRTFDLLARPDLGEFALQLLAIASEFRLYLWRILHVTVSL